MKNSIIYPIIGIIVMLSVAIAAGNYLMSTDSLNRLAEAEMQEVLDATWFMAESNVQHEIDDMEILSVLLKGDAHVQEAVRHYVGSEGDTSKLKEAMDNVFPVLEVDMLAIVDDKENIIYTVRDPESGDDISSFAGVAVALAGNMVTSTSKAEEGWSIVSAVPVEYEGRIFGALVVGELLDDEFAMSLASVTGSDVSLASLDGIFASSLPPDQREILDPDLAGEILTQKRALSASHPQTNKIVSYKPVMIVDQVFVLIVGIDTEVFRQILEENQRTLFYATVIILSIALMIGVLLSKRLIGPLEILREAVDDITRGKLENKIKIRTTNEIGTLADSFNKMTADLKKSRAELEGHSRKLERDVLQRTGELERSKKDLESKVDDMERFSKLSVGRELKMVELKKRIRELENLLKSHGIEEKAVR